LKDLIKVIIPHFIKYPLITQKHVDFLLFKQVVELMNRKEHQTKEGLGKIVNIRASSEGLNLVRKLLTPLLNKAFPTKTESSFSTIQKITFSTLVSSKGGIKIGSADIIGPHNLVAGEVISLIVGSLLGNSYLEKRENNRFAGTRITFVQVSDNVEYLM
jgi:hypothetical protein